MKLLPSGKSRQHHWTGVMHLLLTQTWGKPKSRGLRGREKHDSSLIRPRWTGCCVSCSVMSDSFVTPWIVDNLCPWKTQARILEWDAIPSPGDLPNPEIKPGSPALQADALTSKLPSSLVPQQFTRRKASPTQLLPSSAWIPDRDEGET